MNSELFWSAISGITGILSVIFMLFIEYPRIKSRLKESRSAIQVFFQGVSIIMCFVGAVMFGASMFSLKEGYLRGNFLIEQGRLSLFLIFAGFGIFFLNDFLSTPKSENSKFQWLYFMLAIILIAFSIHYLILIIRL